jgi:hypothetical protein
MHLTASASQDHLLRASDVGFSWAFGLGMWAIVILGLTVL